MPDFTYVLYDTAQFSTTAGVDHRLFQTPEGGDSTHTKDFTNMKGAGALPTSQRFTIKRIEVFPDEALVQADAAIWFVDGYGSVEVNNQEVFRAPLGLITGGVKASGHFSQGVAADRNLLTYSDEGFEFEIPIEVNGGVVFAVVLHQGTALNTATQRIKCCLIGILTIP